MFLLVRGPYAWIGFGWMGCTKGDQPPSPGPAEKGPFTWNVELDSGVGEPLDTCKETAAGSGVFVREWSRASVRMDCNTLEGTVNIKQYEYVLCHFMTVTCVAILLDAAFHRKSIVV